MLAFHFCARVDSEVLQSNSQKVLLPDRFAFPLEQAPFGPFMQMLSVEYLSLAAEATVVLLLLTFAWPKKKAEPVQALETGTTLSWELAKVHYLQSCVHRGLYLQQWQENHSNASAVSAAPELFVPREIEDDPNCPGLPLPWQDRLTRLLNRHGFDAVLNAWLSVEPKYRSESCMAMVTLSKYSELVSTHGAMVTEQALKCVATHLAVSSSGQAFVARYLPDRFVVLRFASQRTTCYQSMALVLQTISDFAFFKVAGESVALPCNISIVSLEGDSDLVSTMDALEEGSIESDKSGRRIISRVAGVWTDEPVADANDNAALLVQIDTNTTHNLPDVEISVAAPPTSVEIEVTSITHEVDSNEVATADDIASLFSTVNSAIKPLESVSMAVVVPTTLKASLPTEDTLGDIANADEIALLFQNATARTPKNAAISSNSSLLPTGEQLSDPASMQDIAALFDSVKSTEAAAVAETKGLVL